MGFFDKAKDKAQDVVGKIKEKVGDATNNEQLQAEGNKDQAAGKIKGAGEDVKDKAAETLNDTKDKFDK